MKILIHKIPNGKGYIVLLQIYQNTHQCSNKILYFIQLALSPAKFVNNEYEFTEKRNAINQQLAFIGYQLNETGKFSEIIQAKTISEAQQKAENLKTKLENRNSTFGSL